MPAEAAARQPATPPNVILVVIDTLRSDHVGAYGYARPTTPQLDRFAAESVRFESVSTVIPNTLPAHLALFTSRYPRELGVLMNGEVYQGDGPLLAEVLRERGYSTAAFTSGFPVHEKFGLARGFQSYESAEGWKSPGGATLAAFREWLSRGLQRPFFVWIHLYDPHVPYRPDTADLELFTIDEKLREWVELRGITIDPAWTSVIDRTTVTRLPSPGGTNPFLNNLNLYDAEIRYADRMTGEILDLLKAAGHYDDSLIMVVSDHGEGLGEHGYYFHGLYLFEEQLRVPLVIRPPGGSGAGATVTAEVSLLDLLPTVLGYAGIPAPPESRGLSLGGLLAGEDDPAFTGRLHFAESRQYPPRKDRSPLHWTHVRRFSVRDGRWKLIRTTEGEAVLFDLVRDPLERHDQSRDNPDHVRRLGRELDAWLQRVPEAEPADTSGLSEADRERLRTLGYVESEP